MSCDYCPAPATTERKSGCHFLELLCAEHAEAHDRRRRELQAAEAAAVILAGNPHSTRQSRAATSRVVN